VADLAVANLGYVVAGYMVAGVGLAAYAAYVLTRGRRARIRAAAIAAKRAR
jgi:hypothetical protein